MNKTYDEELLQRVEEYLASSGMSQNKMAQAVGLSQTALSNWRRQVYHGDPAYVEGKLREYFETQAAREAVEEQAAPYLPDTGYVPTTVSEDIYRASSLPSWSAGWWCCTEMRASARRRGPESFCMTTRTALCLLRRRRLLAL